LAIPRPQTLRAVPPPSMSSHLPMTWLSPPRPFSPSSQHFASLTPLPLFLVLGLIKSRAVSFALWVLPLMVMSWTPFTRALGLTFLSNLTPST
jgi:hypothetical protein